MASTKEMQARAKARKQTTKARNEQVAVLSPSGVQTFDSMDSYFEQVQDSLTRGANAFVAQMNGANVDLTLLDKPTFQSKAYTVGGKKFEIIIHTNNRAVDAIAKHSGRDLGAVIQIWNGSNSALLPMTKDALADARINWNNEARIKAEDTLSQCVAALRLNSNNPAIHHIAMFLAYEHKEFDDGGIHAVWD